MATLDKPDWWTRGCYTSPLSPACQVVQSKETFTPSCLCVFLFLPPPQGIASSFVSSLFMSTLQRLVFVRIPASYLFFCCRLFVPLPAVRHCHGSVSYSRFLSLMIHTIRLFIYLFIFPATTSPSTSSLSFLILSL